MLFTSGWILLLFTDIMAFLKYTIVVLLFAVIIYKFLNNNTVGEFCDNYVTNKTYDYVVVGGGSAGGIVAARLAEDRETTVLIIESGRSFKNDRKVYEPSRWVQLLGTEDDWAYLTEPQDNAFLGMNHNRGPWPRGRIFGGSGSMNVLHYTRGSPFDFDEWAANRYSGWSYKDVLPYFLKTEDMQMEEFKNSPYHSVGGEIAVRGGDESPMLKAFMDAGQELGYDITDYNGKLQEGFSKLQFTIRNGRRSSAGVEFYKSCRSNLDICFECHATKLLFEGKRTVGVTYIQNNRKKIVLAKKEVILSAGSINTPQILMLSGIGPKDHLTELGIPVIADLPVGNNLQDHQQVSACTLIDKPYSDTPGKIFNWWNTLWYQMFGSGPQSTTGPLGNAFIHLKKEYAGKTYAPIQIVLFRHFFSRNILNFKDNVFKELIPKKLNDHGFCTLISLTHPRSRGTIRLKSKDPFDYPLIHPQYFADRRDIQDFIGGIRVWEQMMQTQAYKELGVDMAFMKKSFCSQHKFRSDEYWECIVRHTAFTQFHPTSTCKMGSSDDPTAVVDPELRVRGIDGLRVVDASIFPNITGGNTNAPTIMVAEKAADMIRNKDTVNHLRRSL